MSNGVQQALRGAWRAAPPAAAGTRPRLLVLGGGGMLGSAVLEHALPAGRFARVQALVAQPLASALRSFEPLAQSALDAAQRSGEPLQADIAVLVFERLRHSNRRDEAFVQPQPRDLPALAAALHRGGVRALLVVLPHTPWLLPGALRLGLASLDEAAVAGLGFEHVVFVRAAQVGGPAAASRSWLQRVADAWLRQLRLMVPQREQPLRAALLARWVVALAQALPAAPPGTRVLAPDTLWSFAQPGVDGQALLTRWLHGGGA